MLLGNFRETTEAFSFTKIFGTSQFDAGHLLCKITTLNIIQGLKLKINLSIIFYFTSENLLI